jgi:hypothetical protein
MKYFKLLIVIFSVFIMMSLTACSGGGGGSASDSYTDGTLSLTLTDATTNDYNAVYVTIREVQVCIDDENEDEEASWLVVADPQGTYNLLDLVNGVQEQLGVTDLEAGHYSQMRLIIGGTPDEFENILTESHPYANYIVDSSNQYNELKIPSGLQTGIKLVRGFDIYAGVTTELILDFDASRSIVKAGNSGKWILKPTIKVLGTTVASISGRVDEENNGDLEGVLVSAQIYDSGTGEITVQASTVTDENGAYALYLEPGTYTMVAYLDGYDPQCTSVEAEPNTDYVDVNFSLAAALVGTIGGTVTVDTELPDPSAAISIRQLTQCEPGVDILIQITSFSIGDGGIYSVSLPVGNSYQVVAVSEGFIDPIIYDPVTVSEGVETTLDFEFAPEEP